MIKIVVVAAAKSNLRYQSQTVGTTFCQPALYDAFGPCANNEDNCLSDLNDSLIAHKDADPHTLLLLQIMVTLQSLRDR